MSYARSLARKVEKNRESIRKLEKDYLETIESLLFEINHGKEEKKVVLENMQFTIRPGEIFAPLQPKNPDTTRKPIIDYTGDAQRLMLYARKAHLVELQRIQDSLYG